MGHERQGGQDDEGPEPARLSPEAGSRRPVQTPQQSQRRAGEQGEGQGVHARFLTFCQPQGRGGGDDRGRESGRRPGDAAGQPGDQRDAGHSQQHAQVTGDEGDCLGRVAHGEGR